LPFVYNGSGFITDMEGEYTLFMFGYDLLSISINPFHAVMISAEYESAVG
jgi:hypothetical protein